MPTKTNTRPGFLPQLLRHVILSWLLAVTAQYLLLPSGLRGLEDLEGLKHMSFGLTVGITCSLTLILQLVSLRLDVAFAQRWCMAGTFGLLAVVSLAASFSWAFFAVCLLVTAALVAYALRGWDASARPVLKPKRNDKTYLWATVLLTTAFFLFVSVWTVCRVLSFSTPTFDFGIFAQMFHNMKQSGVPMTTVERDGPLSHFAVHVSPIYYLLLPFYALVPTPATLQVLQAAVIASAVIPLWKLGKHHGLTDLQRLLLCAVLLFYPAYSGATSYDIHENCFLTPLLLWLLYGIDRKNTALTAVCAVLTLMVKEDAAVYVAVVALWLVVRTLLRWQKRDWKDLATGIVMLAGALVWFFLVTGYLSEHGDGVMTYRYDNFIYDGSSSLLTVVKAVLLSPMKAVFECVDSEKLGFIGLTLLPLLGLPLLTRRYERYILLIPYVLVNLMSDYQYQHDIFFQYTFGSTACLMYLTAVNLADLKDQGTRLAALTLAAAVGVGCFCAQIVPRAMIYPRQYIQFSDYYSNIRDTLDLIPEDASVSATTFYTTYLSQRETLYDIRYASREHVLSTQYIVLRTNDENSFKKYAADGETGYKGLVELLERSGYEYFAGYSDVLVIYHKVN